MPEIRGRLPGASRSDAEAGAGTMLMVGVIGILVLLLPIAVAFVVAAGANGRARGAADLGAIAGSGSFVSGSTAGAACSAARAIVLRNRAEPTGCRISAAGIASVSTRTTVRLPLLGRRDAVATARAGPVFPR